MIYEQFLSLVMRCLYQNTPDKEFIIGPHEDDDIVVACGFNGGGFQMGPMVARLAIGQLVANKVTVPELISLLQVGNEEINTDYKIDNVDMVKLLKDMEIKFSPERSTLKDF